ncbi:ABC-F family ATP-binding cassette domain-containing protein [Cucumibacter marinus]|uniref:ABC-F family ATP-binding cassette domain-containing protein n=1 Tax=Cucumibacter marinus TaxID=1121252 RepID=UPI00048BE70E|nr:ATP-binding cassette domain-containing protein [Cucumibacter marinus]
MAPPLLTLAGIELTIGTQKLLDGAELSVHAGDRIALVGRNGSGKSTLMKIAAGLIEPDGGERFLKPGTTTQYLPQEPDLTGYQNVADFVEGAMTVGHDPYRVPYLIGELGLDGSADPATLSGGEARRAALARALAPEPEVLLLDEPTNHLDLPAIEWLEAELRSMKSALVLISHDRRFLTELTRKTVWLDRGIARELNEGFAGFEAWRDKTLEEEETAQHKLDRQIVREEHWLRYGVTARRKRNVRRLGDLNKLRQQRRDYRGPQGNVSMAVTEGRSSGAIVIDAEHLSKAFDGQQIVEDFSIRVMRGDRIGVVGPNGAGKTTLIKLLTGQIEPDAGTIKLGASIELAHIDQRRAALNPDITLKDALTGGGTDLVQVAGGSKHVIAYMKDFLFAPEQAGTPIGVLSGGERARVALARILSLPSNLLVLDEPTNDLDLETLDLLEELVADYKGTVIVVSHDRDFLDRVATSIIMAEGQGQFTEYAGGYSDMVAQRGGGVSKKPVKQAEAAKPVSKPAQAPSAPKPKRKLSFKEKHALETLPARMQTIEVEIAEAERRLADPDFYRKDPEGFDKTSKAHAALQTELEEAEQQWLELEILREELEGS